MIKGEVKAPGSKAYTHRALVASLMTPGETRIKGALYCDDTKRTLDGIRELGANLTFQDDLITSKGPPNEAMSDARIECGDSGATLRFLAAVASVFPRTTSLVVRGVLASRPIAPLLNALNDLGATAKATQDGQELEVKIRGPLKGGKASVPGEISSQFISGLLLASPGSRADVHIRITGELESRPYVDMTLEVLRRHRIKAEFREGQLFVPGPQEYQPAFHVVDGDFSSAAFLMSAAASCGGSVRIRRLSAHSLEPDSMMLDIAPLLGLRIFRKEETLIVERSKLQGFQFDASNNPDLVPALEVIGCLARGPSEITGLRRLRYKESNRLLTVPLELSKMGAKIHVKEDRVRIEEGAMLRGTSLDSHGDHRVAMACSIAALGAHGESIIENAEAVTKSYPDFFDDLRGLGAEIRVE